MQESAPDRDLHLCSSATCHMETLRGRINSIFCPVLRTSWSFVSTQKGMHGRFIHCSFHDHGLVELKCPVHVVQNGFLQSTVMSMQPARPYGSSKKNVTVINNKFQHYLILLNDYDKYQLSKRDYDNIKVYYGITAHVRMHVLPI